MTNAVTEATIEQNRAVSNEALRLEYSEAGAYLRHYSALRFAMLTVYFVIMGGLSAVALRLTDTQTQDFNAARWAAIGAAVVTCVFYVFELVCEKFISHFVNHGRELEKELGFRSLTNRPPAHRLIPGATAVLYVSILGFWICVSIFGT